LHNRGFFNFERDTIFFYVQTPNEVVNRNSVAHMRRSNQSGRSSYPGRGEARPLQTFSPRPWKKCVEHSWKVLDIIQKIWALLRKHFATPGVQAGYGPERLHV